MQAILAMLNSTDRSVRWGGAAGFVVAFLLWLLQQVFKAAWAYDLVVPDWIMVGGPLVLGLTVVQAVSDRPNGARTRADDRRADVEDHGHQPETPK